MGPLIDGRSYDFGRLNEKLYEQLNELNANFDCPYLRPVTP